MDNLLHDAWVLFVAIGSWMANRLTAKLDNLEKRADKIQHTTVPREEYKSDIGSLHKRINDLDRLVGELKGKTEK